MRALISAALLCMAVAGQAEASGYSLFNAGIAAANRADRDDALRLLTSAIAAPDLQPGLLSVAYFVRGGVYFTNKQCDPAIEDFSASLRLGPARFDAYLYRGFCYVVKKQPDLAIADFTSAIGVRPDLAKGYLIRGLFFVQTQRKLDLAIADFTAAIGIQPSDGGIYEIRGNAYRLHADYDKALADENKSIELAPQYPSPYFDRGMIFEDEGKFGDALDNFKKVVELAPANREAALNIGLTQWESGQFNDAAATLENSAKAQPDNAYWTLWVALARTRAAMADDDLQQRVAKLDLSKWPGPVVNVFLGKSTPDQAVQAASVGDADAVSGQKCEANFYIGEWQLLHQNPTIARTMLQDAATACPHEFVEWPAANAELRRMP